MQTRPDPERPPLSRPARRFRRALMGGCVGLAILWAFAVLGGAAQRGLHLALPGPVIGLALLAFANYLARRLHPRSQRWSTLHVWPAGRLLVSHMGLLFVPAGAGIINAGATLRTEWLPLVAGVAGSTLLGLLVTGWLTHRLAPKGAA